MLRYCCCEKDIPDYVLLSLMCCNLNFEFPCGSYMLILLCILVGWTASRESIPSKVFSVIREQMFLMEDNNTSTIQDVF